MFYFPVQTKGALRHISLAIVVGLCGGAGAVVFRTFIEIVQGFFFDFILPQISQDVYGYNISLIFLPAIGGLLVGLITWRVAIETRGYGIPEVMESMHVHAGRIRKRVAFTKIITSAITVGSGGSAGREGPIAQIGASFGSLIGQIVNLSERQRRVLIASGLAAGVGATFNAPLGAAIFAIEILFVEFEAISATSIILASVIGTAFASIFLGPHPAFRVSDGLTFGFEQPLEIVFYLILGLILGVISVLWVRSFYRIEDFFDSVKISPVFKAGMGGVFTGLLGILTLDLLDVDIHFVRNNILGVGYAGMEKILSAPSIELSASSIETTIAILILLGIAKILATSFTIGSGGSGGVFSSSLYIGVMFGGALGLVFNSLFPSIALNSATYALVGAGALFAGTASAPLTCIVLIPEMTRDYSLIPPMMAACVTSYIISSLLMKNSIYTLKLVKKGISMDIDHVLSDVRVEDIMTADVSTIPADMKINDLIKKMSDEGHMGYPITRDDKLFGIITFDDIHRVKEAEPEETVGDVCTREVLTVNPQDSVQKAAEILHNRDIGRLIVVNEGELKRIVGIISKTDIIKAYQRSLRLKKTW